MLTRTLPTHLAHPSYYPSTPAILPPAGSPPPQALPPPNVPGGGGHKSRRAPRLRTHRAAPLLPGHPRRGGRVSACRRHPHHHHHRRGRHEGGTVPTRRKRAPQSSGHARRPGGREEGQNTQHSTDKAASAGLHPRALHRPHHPPNHTLANDAHTSPLPPPPSSLPLSLSQDHPLLPPRASPPKEAYCHRRVQGVVPTHQKLLPRRPGGGTHARQPHALGRP